MGATSSSSRKFESAHQLTEQGMKYARLRSCPEEVVESWYQQIYTHSCRTDHGCHITSDLVCYFLCHQNKIENVFKIWKLRQANIDCQTSIAPQWLYLCGEKKKIDELLEYLYHLPPQHPENDQVLLIIQQILEDQEHWVSQEKLDLYWKGCVSGDNPRLSPVLFS